VSDNHGQNGADDLTRIAGIGSKIARRLSEAGIQTYADLASRSADDIMALLPDVSGLPLARVERWRDQARELAAAQILPEDLPGLPEGLPGLPEGLPDARSNGQHYESFLVRVLLNEDGSVRRTTVQHVGSGEERQWPGLARDALPEFIETKASASVPPPRPGPIPSAPVREPAGEYRAPFGSSAILSVGCTRIRAAEPFTLTMAIDLPEPVTRAGRLAYSAVIVAKPLAGGPKRTVAKSDGLFPSAAPAISVDAAGLPAGTYRLDGVVSLSEPDAERPMGLAAIAEGFLIQVLPG